MDNGHKAIFSGNQESSGPDSDNPELNLNAENWQHSLEISVPKDLPAPETFASPEVPESASLDAPYQPEIATTTEATPREALNPEIITNREKASKTSDTKEELGQIIPIENSISVSPIANRSNGDPSNIESAIDEVKAAINEFNQTGDLNKLYAEAQGMREAMGPLESHDKGEAA